MDTPVELPRRDDYDALAPRVARVEGDVSDIKTVLAELKVVMVRIDTRIETQLPHLATKADVAELEARMERRFNEFNDRFDGRFGTVEGRFGEVSSRFGEIEARLAAMPSKTYMWGILGVLLTGYACGLAALAVLK